MSWKNVLVFELASGKLIIGHTDDNPVNEDGRIVVKNPKLVLLAPVPGQVGRLSLNFADAAPFLAQPPLIEIQPTAVAFAYAPNKALADAYRQALSGLVMGAVLPPAKLAG